MITNKMRREIDREVRRILEEQADRARRIIEEHADQMTVVIDALIENEHISGTEFDRLIAGEADWKDKPENHTKTPVEEKPAEEKAVEEAPAEEAPVEAPVEAPADETPAPEGENE